VTHVARLRAAGRNGVTGEQVVDQVFEQATAKRDLDAQVSQVRVPGVYAVLMWLASCRPSSVVDVWRILNFCIFPVIVIGKSEVNLM
jgi:hypothetical protein